MSLYRTVTSKTNPPPTMQDIKEAFDGNLCRFTGYRPILDAAKTFASDKNKLPGKGSSTLTSTTLDKCISFATQNSSSPKQVEFPQKLRNFIPQSLPIKGIISFDSEIS